MGFFLKRHPQSGSCPFFRFKGSSDADVSSFVAKNLRFFLYCVRTGKRGEAGGGSTFSEFVRKSFSDAPLLLLWQIFLSEVSGLILCSL